MFRILKGSNEHPMEGPKQLHEIYFRACSDIDEALIGAFVESGYKERPAEPQDGETAMLYGPAHIIWADGNFGQEQWCLEQCNGEHYANWYPPALEIVRRSLRELQELPEEIKGFEDDDDETID